MKRKRGPSRRGCGRVRPRRDLAPRPKDDPLQATGRNSEFGFAKGGGAPPRLGGFSKGKRQTPPAPAPSCRVNPKVVEFASSRRPPQPRPVGPTVPFGTQNWFWRPGLQAPANRGSHRRAKSRFPPCPRGCPSRMKPPVGGRSPEFGPRPLQRPFPRPAMLAPPSPSALSPENVPRHRHPASRRNSFKRPGKTIA
jgi:hypothetical protein